jgi:putative membrane protein
VLGDLGIHERVGQAYWERLVEAVLAHFRDERPRDGLLHAVGEVGAILARHFPRRPDDVNELSDQVSIDP